MWKPAIQNKRLHARTYGRRPSAAVSGERCDRPFLLPFPHDLTLLHSRTSVAKIMLDGVVEHTGFARR